MKFNYRWLQERVNTKLSPEKLAHQLSMFGLEVDEVLPAIPDFSGIVVGEVLKVDKHPNADKLHICQVNVGKKTSLEIVCGAPNVYEGMKAPVALVGAILPGDFNIKEAKLRGVASFGMICSAKELGISEESQGLLELPTDAPIGENIRDYLVCDDTVFDIELTPNRGDCLSITGVAREVAAQNRLKLKPIKVVKTKPTIKDEFPVKLTASNACPRYVGRIIRHIDVTAKTPIWMQERLRRCGIRPIAPIVDVTNYVLLELGQPMHAFDFAKLDGGINVRFSKKGEKLTLLNDETVTLHEKTLVIADQNKPLAIAGVMGGLASAVSDTTKDIFLESAFFNPINIMGCARSYGLQTDSSYRFERGVDFMLQRQAIDRATELLLQIVGGEPGPIIEAVEKKQLPKIAKIQLRIDRVKKLLGITIPKREIVGMLSRLGLSVKEKGADLLSVEIPSYRFDLNIEVDLIEEIARLYGYNHIPTEPCYAELTMPPIDSAVKPRNDIRRLLQSRDYHEIVTYSFINVDDQQLFEPDQIPIPLLNPIASNMSVMRTSLWPSLVRTLEYNLNRQQTRVRFFETGLQFQKHKGKTVQNPVLSGLVYGSALPEQWGEKTRPADFYDVKSDLEALFALTKASHDFEFEPAQCTALHPGQSTMITKAGKRVGTMGLLHPSIAQTLGLPNNIYLFELNLAVLEKVIVPHYIPISKFPMIRRDLAMIVNKEIPVAQIENLVQKEGGEILSKITIFDLYQRKEMQLGEKSVALGLTLQHPSRTLNDREVNNTVDRIVNVLKLKLNMKLRE